MNRGPTKYDKYAQHVKEVCDVRALVLFVYLDLLLLSFFLGYLLFSQLNEWVIPVLLSVPFFSFSILLFHIFVKDK